jgi:hypothetical protein
MATMRAAFVGVQQSQCDSSQIAGVGLCSASGRDWHALVIDLDDHDPRGRQRRHQGGQRGTDPSNYAS